MESAARLASREGKIAIAGSDSHTIAGVGQTYTEVPGARTVDEFFAGLRTGRGRIHGVHGSCGKLTQTFQYCAVALLDKPWTLAMFSVRGAGTCVYGETLVERNSFLPKWTAALEHGDRRKRMLWGFGFEL